MSAFTDRVDLLGATYHNRLSGAATLTPRVGTGNFSAGAGATLGATGGGADGEDCVSFDGSSSGNYIDIQSPADDVSYRDRIKETFSLFLAFNLDTNAKDQVLWQMGGKDRGIFLTVDGSTENLGLLFWDFNTAYELTTSAPSTGSWHTLVISSDTGVPDEVEVYIDGTSVGTIDVSGMGNEKITPGMVVLGDAGGSNGSGGADARIAGDSSTRVSTGSGEVDGALADFAFFADVVLTSTNASDLHSDWAGSGGGDDYTLAVNDISVSASVDNATITQNHVISVNDISVGSSIDNATITQDHSISPADIEVGASVDNTSLSLSAEISPNGIEVGSSIDGASITQNHALSPDGIEVGSSIENTSITVDGAIDVNDISVGSSIDPTTITQNHVISPADMSVSVSLDAATISQVHVISVDDAEISVSIENTSLTTDAYLISPNDISVSSSIDTASITQVHILSPVDMSVACVIDVSTISQLHLISPQDMQVSVSIDNTTIVIVGDQEVASATVSLAPGFSGSVGLAPGFSMSVSLENVNT